MSETINVNVGLPTPGTNTTINVNVQGAGQTAPAGGAGPSLDLPSTSAPAAPAAGGVSSDQNTTASTVNWQTQNVNLDNIDLNEAHALLSIMQGDLADGNLSAGEMQVYEKTLAFYAQDGSTPAPAPTPTPAPAGGSAPTGGAPAPTTPPAPTNAWSVGDAPLNDADRSFSSVGDPHETAGDGTKFDNELVGDFVKLKSASGDFELETRQEHDDKGRWAGKTLNKMAAVKSGNDTVVYNGDGPGPHSLTINGQNMPLTPGKTYDLPGGGSVTCNTDGVKIVSNKGDEVNIKQQDGYIDIKGELSPLRKDGEVRGSLGNFHNDGNKGEDFMGPDGKIYSNAADFENAWRPQGSDQLFGGATGGAGPTGGSGPSNNNSQVEQELAQMAQEIAQLTKEVSQLKNEVHDQHKNDPKGGGKHEHHPGRVHEQLHRIAEGVKHGWLTQSQADELKKRVEEIAKEEKADRKANHGHLTAEEKAQFKRELDGTSGDIFEQKQTGRVQKLEQKGRLTQTQENALVNEIQQSAVGIRQNGKDLGKDYKALQADIRKDEPKHHHKK